MKVKTTQERLEGQIRKLEGKLNKPQSLQQRRRLEAHLSRLTAKLDGTRKEARYNKPKLPRDVRAELNPPAPKQPKAPKAEKPQPTISRETYLADLKARRETRAADRAARLAASLTEPQPVAVRQRQPRYVPPTDAEIVSYLTDSGWTEVAPESSFFGFNGLLTRPDTWRATPVHVPSYWTRLNWDTTEGECVRTLRQAFRVQYTLGCGKN
jgi:hypothetical protein